MKRFDAVGANHQLLAVHGFSLEIKIETAFGFNHGVTTRDAGLRSASAVLTYFRHILGIVVL